MQERAPTAGTVRIAEAAALLGISVEGVRKRIKRGHLPATKIGEEWQIARSVVDEAVRRAALAEQTAIEDTIAAFGPTVPTELTVSDNAAGVSGLTARTEAPTDLTAALTALLADPTDLTTAEAIRLAADLAGQLALERQRSAQLEAELAQRQDERAELYGRLGYFQGQLDQARADVLRLTPPSPLSPAPRSWWRFWERR